MPLDFKTSLDPSGFERGLAQIDSSATRSAGRIEAAFTQMGSRVTASLGAAGVAGAFAKAIQASVDFASRIGDSAEAMGLTVETFQGYVGVLERGGVEQVKFEKGFGVMLQKMDDAREGNEKLIASFEKLGVTWEMLSTGSPEQVFEQIALGLSTATDATQAYAAAADIFGKGNGRIIAQLRELGGSLSDHAAAVDKLGIEQQKTLDAWGDAWQSWKRSALVAMGDVFATAAKGVRNFAEQATFLATGTKRSDVESAMAGGLTPPEAKAAASAGPDPRLAKRLEENNKLLEQSQKEYDRLEKEAFDEMSKRDKEWLRMHEKKEAALRREIELQKELKNNETRGRMDRALADVNRLEGANAGIRENAMRFSMLSPDDRRSQVRAERLAAKQEKRLDRLAKTGQQDARFGANRPDRDISAIALNDSTIQALKKAFFEANSQLIAG